MWVKTDAFIINRTWLYQSAPEFFLLLLLFGSISNSYKSDKTQKKEKPFDFSSVVDYTDKFSSFFEDLLRLDRFSRSAEDELNRNVSEEEESRDDL